MTRAGALRCVFDDCSGEVVHVNRRLCGRHYTRVMRGVETLPAPAPAGRAPARDWLESAACSGADPELFFPVGTSGPALEQIAEAKAVCRRCPVAEQCLAWAIETGQDAGVWGGLSEDERRQLKADTRQLVTAGGNR
jgi:WhiB family redox-sensing transcriptional regulator